jgi:hypothetical protein
MSYTNDPNLKRQLRGEWEDWADEFKGARPLLQEQLGLFGERAIQRSIALDDLRNMLNDPKVTTQGKLRSILNEMVTIYDDYVNQRDFNTSITIGNKQDYQEQLRLNAKTALEDLAQSDPNAQAAYNSLFDPLFN